ncbi:hypothetical protein SMA90_28065, partial [Escherichia coli]
MYFTVCYRVDESKCFCVERLTGKYFQAIIHKLFVFGVTRAFADTVPAVADISEERVPYVFQ